MSDRIEYLTGLLGAEFQQILADRKIKGGERTEALIECVDRLLENVCAIHFRGGRAGIEHEVRNDGDITLNVDGNGRITSIDLGPEELIADFDFWMPQ